MIDDIKAVALDIDGTLCYGNTLIDGAKELVDFFKEKNLKVFYLTNNSSKTRLEVVNKLSSLGFELSEQDLYTSAYTVSVYLKQSNFNNIFVLGEKGLIKEISSQGINITEGENAEAVVIGLDTEFSYEKLVKVTTIVLNGAKIIACNYDVNYPGKDCKTLPGCGALVSSIESASNRKVDYIAGKPNTLMIELLSKDMNLKNHEILVIGDSYSSDIEMAKKFGCSSILISSDNSYKNNTESNLLVFKNLKDIFNYFSYEKDKQ
jgi:HAD superfamily hydrolase (TIGR01450 family)